MNYKDIYFPNELSFCFSKSIEFLTSICISKNKKENRFENWDNPRFKYNLVYNNLNKNLFNKLQSFFLICKGCKFAFNFKDIDDNRIEHQQIGVGDGLQNHFTIYKNYSYNNTAFKRKIQKVNNEKVFINEQIVDKNNYNIINDTIYFNENSIPNNDDIISIEADFYIILRFSNDFIKVEKTLLNSYILSPISLLEVNV